MEDKNVCAVCNIFATQRCTGCQAVHYCSQEHQKSHWKIHSKNCRAYKLVDNSQIGRHYVATRNIKVGETVLYERTPLITAPTFHKAIKMGTGDYAMSLATPPVCLDCYVELTADNAKCCYKCGWPLCRKCTKHDTECEFTIKHRKSKVNISKTEYGRPHPAYEIIGVIRALALRDNDPKAYRKLLNLQSYSSTAVKKIDHLNSIDKAARFVKTFFEIDNVEVAEICKIIGIIQINAYKTSVAECAALYSISSYIEHNCRPNCSKSFTAEGGVVFWAAVPISKGDHITTCYVKSFWGTKKRQEHLSTTKFFQCICERCKDPTEFGTMFNAIKCTEGDCNGYALPLTYFVTEGNYADFVCRECNKTVPRQLSESLEESINFDRATLQTGNINQYRRFIERWREDLHENNSHIVEVEIEWACEIADSMPDLPHKSKEYIADVVKFCTKLIELLRILAPAEHSIRATVLYVKFQAVMLTYRDKSLTIDDKLAYAKKFQKDLNEVQELLRRESACHPFEYSILKIVREMLQKLRTFENTASNALL